MTSATFCFLGEHPAPASVTLYLSLDCDPQGAANYLRAMLTADRGASPVAFIHANRETEIVCGHDVYPNTWYAYTLCEQGIQVQKRKVLFEEGWETVFAGTLLDFLNSQPGAMVHHVALYPEGRLGYYQLSQLVSYVNIAEREVARVAGLPGAGGLEQARRRVEELKAVTVACHRVEEAEAIVA